MAPKRAMATSSYARRLPRPWQMRMTRASVNDDIDERSWPLGLVGILGLTAADIGHLNEKIGHNARGVIPRFCVPHVVGILVVQTCRSLCFLPSV